MGSSSVPTQRWSSLEQRRCVPPSTWGQVLDVPRSGEVSPCTQLARSSNRRWPHVVRRCNRRKTTNGSRSGASDCSGGRSIFMPSSRHRLKSRPRGHKCAASVSTEAYTSALSSVQTYDVRRVHGRKCAAFQHGWCPACWTTRSLKENWQVPRCRLLNWAAGVMLRRVLTTSEAKH